MNNQRNIAIIFAEQMGRSEELGTGVQNVFRYNKIYSKANDNIFEEDDVFVTTVPLSIFNKHDVVDNVVDNVVDIKLIDILKLISACTETDDFMK